MVQFGSLVFFLGKAYRQVWTGAGWSRRWFHSKQWSIALATAWRPYSYVNIYTAREVYFSLHGAAVVKQVFLNPNDSLSTCYLTEGVWKCVKILGTVNGNHNLTH